MHADETVTYLEMTDRWQFVPSEPPPLEIELKRAEIPCPELNRFFYTAVGGDWFWIDRLAWTYEQWLEYITEPGHETWVAYVQGTPAGYFELHPGPDADVELAYFGILPHFVGQGLGGRLLTLAVERAWQKTSSRVWLHTSSFDHPYALANYLARGFRVYKKETATKCLPDQSPGPWPGANRPPAGPL
jgi:GNAT superfamily N-acetyltransferase